MGISEQKLFNLLQKVLGDGKVVSKDEVMFICPFSHHRKPKLAVNLVTQRWQSWIDTNAKGRTIYALFKRLQVPSNYFVELSRIVKLPKGKTIEETTEKFISLPYEYKKLTETHKDKFYNKAVSYLKKRNIMVLQILDTNQLLMGKSICLRQIYLTFLKIYMAKD